MRVSLRDEVTMPLDDWLYNWPKTSRKKTSFGSEPMVSEALMYELMYEIRVAEKRQRDLERDLKLHCTTADYRWLMSTSCLRPAFEMTELQKMELEELCRKVLPNEYRQVLESFRQSLHHKSDRHAGEDHEPDHPEDELTNGPDKLTETGKRSDQWIEANNKHGNLAWKGTPITRNAIQSRVHNGPFTIELSQTNTTSQVTNGKPTETHHERSLTPELVTGRRSVTELHWSTSVYSDITQETEIDFSEYQSDVSHEEEASTIERAASFTGVKPSSTGRVNASENPRQNATCEAQEVPQQSVLCRDMDRSHPTAPELPRLLRNAILEVLGQRKEKVKMSSRVSRSLVNIRLRPGQRVSVAPCSIEEEQQLRTLSLDDVKRNRRFTIN